MKNLKQSLKAAKQQIRRLKERVDNMIGKEGITLVEEDAEDVLSIASELEAMVQDHYYEDTPKRFSGSNRQPQG